MICCINRLKGKIWIHFNSYPRKHLIKSSIHSWFYFIYFFSILDLKKNSLAVGSQQTFYKGLDSKYFRAKWNFHTFFVGIQNGIVTLEDWQFLIKLNIYWPYNTAVPLLDIYPREMKTYNIHTKICICKFIAVSFRLQKIAISLNVFSWTLRK